MGSGVGYVLHPAAFIWYFEARMSEVLESGGGIWMVLLSVC